MQDEFDAAAFSLSLLLTHHFLSTYRAGPHSYHLCRSQYFNGEWDAGYFDVLNLDVVVAVGNSY